MRLTRPALVVVFAAILTASSCTTYAPNAETASGMTIAQAREKFATLGGRGMLVGSGLLDASRGIELNSVQFDSEGRHATFNASASEKASPCTIPLHAAGGYGSGNVRTNRRGEYCVSIPYEECQVNHDGFAWWCSTDIDQAKTFANSLFILSHASSEEVRAAQPTTPALETEARAQHSSEVTTLDQHLETASPALSVTTPPIIPTSIITIPGRANSKERRVALVIGNTNYKYVPRLSNPANDARLIAETLKNDGFALVGGKAQIDLDKPAFDRAVQDFGNQLPGASIALFYYAGHGIQMSGANYLIPTSANPTKESDADFQLVDAESVLHQMQDGGARLNVIVLDACRNNPFGGRGLRSTSGGLAQMQAPEGTLISYATQPGNVASDGNGSDSPYTEALVQAIRQPRLDVFHVFNEVGLLVKKKTGGAQQPWLSSSPIEGEFYFLE